MKSTLLVLVNKQKSSSPPSHIRDCEMGLSFVKNQPLLNICVNETRTQVQQKRGLAAPTRTAGALGSALLSHYL